MIVSADITYKGNTVRLSLNGLEPQEVFASLVSTLLAKHKFMSLNAFIVNVQQIVEMIISVYPAGKEKEITRLKRSINKRVQLLDKYRKETDFLEQDIWNMVLSTEGMPNLRGFGFCNKASKDKLFGNAERVSLTDKIKENN